MTLRFLQFSLYIILLCILFCVEAGAEKLGADIAIQRGDKYKGEPFLVQIKISGSEKPNKPDMSKMTDFDVEYLGGKLNSSSYSIYVNGRPEQKTVSRGYIFNYRFVPKKNGNLVIPSVTILAEGNTAKTRPVKVNIQKPIVVDNIKFKLKLSKTNCYVGEPITLTAKLYFGTNVSNAFFNIPILDETDMFHIIDPTIDIKPGTEKQYERIPVNKGTVIGKVGQGKLNGKEYATLTFKKILVPKKSGQVLGKPANFSCNALVGYRKRKSPFDNDFFSDILNHEWFGSQKGVYKKTEISSNILKMTISDVPFQGRPEGFAGHIGEYRLKAAAVPTQISVGDPITLTITLNGPEYLEHIKLPNLSKQPKLKNDFKIPQDRASGEVSGNKKIFTQTIRALRPDITSIPPIELSYFNTRTGKFSMAKTQPIPISVKSVRVVTALDAEGLTDRIITGSEVETWSGGIAHNYEDLSVLENQYHDPVTLLLTPVWFCVFVFPPAIYIILLSGLFFIKRRHADPAAVRARKAGTRLIKSLKNAKNSGTEDDCAFILDTFRSFFGDKLGIPPGALTYNDIKGPLQERYLDTELLNEIKSLFQNCEAGSYAGLNSSSDTGKMIDTAMSLGEKLVRRL